MYVRCLTSYVLSDNCYVKVIVVRQFRWRSIDVHVCIWIHVWNETVLGLKLSVLAASSSIIPCLFYSLRKHFWDTCTCCLHGQLSSGTVMESGKFKLASIMASSQLAVSYRLTLLISFSTDWCSNTVYSLNRLWFRVDFLDKRSQRMSSVPTVSVWKHMRQLL